MSIYWHTQDWLRIAAMKRKCCEGVYRSQVAGTVKFPADCLSPPPLAGYVTLDLR
jgi:hypothetical protein